MLGVNEVTQLSNSAWEMEQAVRCQPEPWRSRSGQPRRVWRRCVPVCLRPPSPEVSPQRTGRNEAGPPAAPARLFGSGNSEGQRSHEQRGTAGRPRGPPQTRSRCAPPPTWLLRAASAPARLAVRLQRGFPERGRQGGQTNRHVSFTMLSNSMG